MDYFNHLLKDKKLATILTQPFPPLQLRQNVPLRLMASIMSQQLNTKVAKIIFNRFLELFGSQEPNVQQVLAVPIDTLRSIGLSNAKANYVKNVAAFCHAHAITDATLQTLSNIEIIELLTQIKGVGQWTVEMLLMFTLGREDILALDDLGIQQAMMSIYNIKANDKKLIKEKILKISSKWAPYRTYACMHLWRWKDTPVEV